MIRAWSTSNDSKVAKKINIYAKQKISGRNSIWSIICCRLLSLNRTTVCPKYLVTGVETDFFVQNKVREKKKIRIFSPQLSKRI